MLKVKSNNKMVDGLTYDEWKWVFVHLKFPARFLKCCIMLVNQQLCLTWQVYLKQKVESKAESKVESRKQKEVRSKKSARSARKDNEKTVKTGQH